MLKLAPFSVNGGLLQTVTFVHKNVMKISLFWLGGKINCCSWVILLKQNLIV